MDLGGWLLLEAEIGIPIVVAHYKWFGLRLHSREDTVLAAMAARCPDKAPVAEAETIRSKLAHNFGRKKEDVAALESEYVNHPP